MTTLLKGDCLEVMKGMASKSVDCFICDLPYGCLGRGAGALRHTEGAFGRNITWDVKIDLVEFWKQVKRLARNDHTPVLMFCNTRFGAELIASNPDWFRYDLVWSKPQGVGFLSANKQPLRSHELIYVFAKKGAYYKRVDVQIEGAKAYNTKDANEINVYRAINHIHMSDGTDGLRCVKSVIEIANKKGKGNHPTAKPVELYKWLLERYCPSDGTMLDPTAGSFNSVFTANEMGRKAIGIEKDDAFFWKAVGKSANTI